MSGPRSHRRGSVSLFPFLAVLVCTMGALVVLLVVIARQTRLQSIRAAEAAVVTTDDSRQRWEELQGRLDHLRAMRARLADQVAQAEQMLPQRTLETGRLEQELAALGAARAQLAASPSPDAAQQELAELRVQIAALRHQLESAQGRRPSGPSYAIVPYAGPNQTRRRPIYIECRADSLVLQPEGVVLTEDDFNGPLDAGNPLAAAVRAAEEYLVRQQHAGGQASGRPYPLLLVRPDGINAYYAARAALRTWGSDFGYELIEKEWKLDFQPADANLLAVEQQALELARDRQQLLARAFGMGGGGSSGKASGDAGGNRRPGAIGEVAIEARPSFRVDPAGGGLIRENSGDRAGRIARSSRPPGRLPEARDSGGWSGSGGGVARSEEERVLESGSSSAAPDARAPWVSAPASTEEAVAGMAAASASGLSAGQPPGSGTNGSTTSTPASGGALRNPASDVAVASDQNQPAILPQQMYGQREAPGPAGHSESLAKTRGTNWGLPDASRSSFPVTRPIRMECRADSLTLLSESAGGGPRKVIPWAERTADSVDALVAAVWEEMDRWGIAGRGLYWRPVLDIEAAPGGEQRVADLKALLADSGLEVRERNRHGARQASHYDQ